MAKLKKPKSATNNRESCNVVRNYRTRRQSNRNQPLKKEINFCKIRLAAVRLRALEIFQAIEKANRKITKNLGEICRKIDRKMAKTIKTEKNGR